MAATARAAAFGGNSQGNSRSLRHLCWCFPQGSGSAGSWEPPRARDWESPGAARSSRADGSGREQPAAAWRRSRHAYSGVLTQEARETGSAWKAEAQRVAEASRGAIHHRGSSNICARICLFTCFMFLKNALLVDDQLFKCLRLFNFCSIMFLLPGTTEILRFWSYFISWERCLAFPRP